MPLFDFLSGKRVALLGATGRVGRALWPRMAQAGPADLLLTGSTSDRAPDGIERWSTVRYERLRLPEDAASLSEDVDYVVVLAGIAYPGIANADPIRAIDLNVEGPRRVVDRFGAAHPRIVLASTVRSSAVSSAYAATKIALEQFVAWLPAERNVTAVRLGNVLKGANVLDTLIKSIAGQAEKAKIFSSTEYFQPTPTLPYTFHLAMDPDVQPGTLLTYLMHSIPVPFVAGLLAGTRIAEVTKKWNPPFERLAQGPYQEPGLLPEWWYPYTTFATIEREAADIPQVAAGAERELTFLNTNFRRQSDVRRGVEVRGRAGDQSNADFGQFVEWLRVEGILPEDQA